MDLSNFLNRYFGDRPAIIQWLSMYGNLVQLVDDVVDEEKDVERTIATFSLARRVFTHPVYLTHLDKLDVVCELVNTFYGVSVKWENSGEAWKITHADSIRHYGYSVFFAVVYLYAGRGALEELAEGFMTATHEKHLNDFKDVFTNFDEQLKE